MPSTESPRHRGEPATHRGEAAAFFKRSPAAPSPSHRAAHRAPRKPLLKPAALALGTLTVAGIVGAASLSGGSPTNRDDEIPAGQALGASTDDASRGAQRLPLLDTGGEAAQAGSDTADAAKAEKKAAAAAAEKKRRARLAKERLANAIENPRAVAEDMLADYGWGAGQMSCLDALWQGESNWDYRATNPSSGAYGIPQSLPASKMAAAGSDWRTNPVTQIKWGLGYIQDVYGSPCSANAFKSGNNWY